MGSVAGSAKHTFREIPTPNADPLRTSRNWTSGAKCSVDLCIALRSKLPEKRRKDAVLCIEYLITASPEWLKRASAEAKRQYFNGAISWLRRKHGPDNVLCVNLQLDETSEHLVAYVLPKTVDGRLSAKDFLGGRKKLSAIQTEFWQDVGKPVGLQRGLEGSTAKHTTAKQYSATLAVNPRLNPPRPPTPSIADHLAGRAKKMLASYADEATAHAALIHQTQASLALMMRAREKKARELRRLREDAAEASNLRVEAQRLKNMNAKLQASADEQISVLKNQVSHLVALLQLATVRISSLVEAIKKWKARIKFHSSTHSAQRNHTQTKRK